MQYPRIGKINKPLDQYVVNGLRFRHKMSYKGVFWGVHLGEDIIARAGTDVKSIGKGRVVYSGYHPGSSQKGNWGHIVIIGHTPTVKLYRILKKQFPQFSKRKNFYSLYGHLGSLNVKKGDRVKSGQVIGQIGRSYTPENGWWVAHLHFSIYVGPWRNRVLPGYFRSDQNLTKLEYWLKASDMFDKVSLDDKK